MDRPTLHPCPSQSYLYPTSIPATPSLLSRPPSQTRLRPARSVPTSASASAPSLRKPARRGIKTPNTNETEDDWITRTASTLTLTRLEEKGQSWLAARNSSTSLTGGEVGDVLDGGGYDGYEGGWSQSRVASGSRLQSARQSRRGSGGKESGGLVMVGPDFVNVEEEEEGVEEDVDEGEMRRLVMGRFGGTIDWAVGWMDFRGEGEDEEEDAGVDQENRMKGELDPVELQKRLCKKKRRDDEATCGNNAKGLVRPPPEGNQASVWNDAKWLLGLATKIAL